jgi:RND family efflux transporter MFP subunit
MSDSAPAPLAALPTGRGTPIRRRRRRWPWVVGALVLAAAAAVMLTPRTLDVQTSTVMTAYPSARFAQLTASGYVVAQRRASVASKATGRVVALLVREGSVLKAGDLIARLDSSDVQAAIAAAEAAVAQAQAAQAQARAALQQAQVELGNAEAELQRAQGLQQQGFVSPQALDAARRRVDVAKAALASAQAGIAAAQAGQAQAQAQLKTQLVNRDNTEVRAPFDGVVLVKNANVGDMITPFSSAAGTSGAVVTMADMSTLEVEADVAEANVGKVRVEQPVEIALDALPELRFARQRGAHRAHGRPRQGHGDDQGAFRPDRPACAARDERQGGVPVAGAGRRRQPAGDGREPQDRGRQGRPQAGVAPGGQHGGSRARDARPHAGRCAGGERRRAQARRPAGAVAAGATGRRDQGRRQWQVNRATAATRR